MVAEPQICQSAPAGRLRTALALGILLGFALALRVAAIFALDSHHVAFTYEHGEIAENLLAGRGFTVRFLGGEGPTSQQAPAYPILLAAIYAALGTGAPALLAMQLLQAVAGTILVLVTVWLVWTLLPNQRPIGWMAGLLAAVAPPHIYMVTHIQVVTWAALGLTAMLALALSPRVARSGWGIVATGVTIGLTLLFEPILALAAPLAAWGIWRANRRELRSRAIQPSTAHNGVPQPASNGSWLRAVSCTAAVTAVAMAVVAPWVVRNYRVHGEFVFIKSTFGYAFWQANNPDSFGTDKIPKQEALLIAARHDGSLAGVHGALVAARHETIYIDDLLLKPTGYREFEGMSELERSRHLGAKADAFIRDHPAEYARLCLQRLRYFLLGDETNPKAGHAVYRVFNLCWLLLVGLGAWMLRSQWRQLWPLAAVFATVMLFHVLTITSARFRIPLEPLTLVWAAAPLAALWAHITRRASNRTERFLKVAES